MSTDMSWCRPLFTLVAIFLLAISNRVMASGTEVPEGSSAAQATMIAKQLLNNPYARLPLSFESNEGQIENEVQFFARANGYTILLSSTEAVISLITTPKAHPAQDPETNPPVLRMQLVGANARSQGVGKDRKVGKSHYFLGKHPNDWITHIQHFGQVRYQGIYPGIDLVYYGQSGHLEYDFVVAPDADYTDITLGFSGADRLEIDSTGDLILHIGGSQFRQQKPQIYQVIGGTKQLLSGRFVLKDNDRVGFTVAAYDAEQPLIIDPVLVYSTFFGGSRKDQGHGIALDPAGNIYITGRTRSAADFPKNNPVQPDFGGFTADAFVTKLNPAGDTLIYSTYLGGKAQDSGYSIAVDASGSAYVVGSTESTDFPVKNPISGQDSLKGKSDAFITKLSPAGDILVYSTYLGGTDDEGDFAGRNYDIAVDDAGSAHVTGTTLSKDFPLVNPFQDACAGGTTVPVDESCVDVFVAKLKPSGSALAYSTYLGGRRNDLGSGIKLDAAGHIYVTGGTASTNFTAPKRCETVLGGSGLSVSTSDAFVAKLDPSRQGASQLLYCTYLGGDRDDFGVDLDVDSSGNIYVTGFAESTNFPIKNPVQGSISGALDVFVTKLDPSQPPPSQLVYSTYLGGSRDEVGNAIAVDAAGKVFVGGTTESLNFPIKNAEDVQESFGGGPTEAFVTKLDPSQPPPSQLVYSTFLGGSANENTLAASIGARFSNSDLVIDAEGSVYLTGGTGSTDFPLVDPIQDTCAGSSCQDAFIAKIEEISQPVFMFEYAAKIICGLQPDPQDMRLTRGFYGTAINIHNPNPEGVAFFKKLALTFPPKEQRPGKILPIGNDKLKLDEALEVDCMDIQRKLFPNGFPRPGYIKGFVVIQSNTSLDITAVYTAASLNKHGKAISHSSIDVEQIRERRRGRQELPDLIPVPDENGSFCVLFDNNLVVTVKNQGLVRAEESRTEVHYFDLGVSQVLDTSEIDPDGSLKLLFPIPPDFLLREFRIRVDVDGDIMETNEENNEAIDECIVVE